ncbi:MAG: sulfoxide reductase heme-binding subunit YedZ [Nitrosomonadales bacterium]|nr:sulfoxide reductase heme-binding subunit YedZ [Nitrosomonadales bacterium]
MPTLSRLAVIPRHIGKIKVLVLLAALSPVAGLGIDYYRDNLGFDPLDRITRSSGLVSLVLLLATLTITPLRHLLTGLMTRIHATHGKRLSDWNWLVKLRRTIGLLAFFYAAVHLLIYFWLDQGGSIEDVMLDLRERAFLAVGMLAFVMLVPLALTANNYMMARLGRNWRRLHRSVYLIAILSVAHFWMLTKVGVFAPLPYMFILTALLGWRLWYSWIPHARKMIDEGMEIPERAAGVYPVAQHENINKNPRREP